MFRKVSAKPSPFYRAVVLIYLALGLGCHLQQQTAPEKGAGQPVIERIAVVGFQAAMSQGEGPEVMRDPLSGSVFTAEPLSQDVVKKMTEILFDRLINQKKYEMVSPGQSRGVFSSIVHSDSNLGIKPIKMFQELGKRFGVDAVLIGYIYRWRERDGTEYGVSHPASVGFDLHLVSPETGAILWTAKFDKTQRSLAENLFDFATFLHGKGKWMTAEELAMLGLQRMLEEMPGGKTKKEES
jgi:hypothetical protein